MQNASIKFRLISISVILLSCNQSHPHLVTRNEELRQTEFVPALETVAPLHKNIIYAPAFLFAWERVKQTLKDSIFIDDANSTMLKIVNQSHSFENSLAEGDYDAQVTVRDDRISAKAFFNKALPFLSKMEKIDEGIIFKGQKVAAFGMRGAKLMFDQFSQILYYKNDEKFILKFSPKDTLNEIILVKGLPETKTLADVITQTNILIKTGDVERQNRNKQWKYNFDQKDSFSVPVIKFNIETHYKGLEGKIFTAAKAHYRVETASQRTTFTLNENGAVVEREGETAVMSLDTLATQESHPKKMTFDKTFYIIIKYVNRANPYFVMKVDNAELLNKLQKK
jgi:hypothetical protein